MVLTVVAVGAVGVGRAVGTCIVGFAIPHAAGIGKHAQAHGALVFHAGEGEEQFGGGIGFIGAAVVNDIARVAVNLVHLRA